MSKRPNIQTRHEQRIERTVQTERRKRDAAMKAAGRASTAATAPVPSITCYGRGRPAGPIPQSVQTWIDQQARAQMKRYRRLVRDMDALAPLRERWVAEFFERITGPRGFSVHAGTRRTIRPEELPVRPNRPWRVVW